MFAIRQSISLRLFIVMSPVATMVIVFLTVMTALNMRTGFARYLALAELSRFDRMIVALVESSMAKIVYFAIETFPLLPHCLWGQGKQRLHPRWWRQ